MENTRTTGTFCSMQSMKAVRSMTRSAAGDGFAVADVADELRVRVLVRVAVVDALHGGALEDRVGLQFRRAQSRARVRGKEGVARAAGKEDDFAVFHALDGGPLAV